VVEYDKEIVNLAQQVLGQRQPISELLPAEPKTEQRAPEVAVEARQEPTLCP
jgi:hypothetical protein